MTPMINQARNSSKARFTRCQKKRQARRGTWVNVSEEHVEKRYPCHTDWKKFCHKRKFEPEGAGSCPFRPALPNLTIYTGGDTKSPDDHCCLVSLETAVAHKSKTEVSKIAICTTIIHPLQVSL